MANFYSVCGLMPLALISFVLSCSASPTSSRPTHSKSAADSKKSTKKVSSKEKDGDDESSDDDESTSGVDDENAKESEKEEDSGKVDPAPKEPTPKENVMVLDNFRWEMPCEKMDGDELCYSNVKVDETKTIGGKSADVYEVELQFRGVAEPMKYKGGQREGDRFYIGGTPDNPTYNIYSISVSNPKQVYYLNWASDTSHDTFAINYKVKVKIAGGSTVKLLGDGQNDKMIANFKNAMAPEIKSLPDASNKGQFIQMNVISANLSN